MRKLDLHIYSMTLLQSCIGVCYFPDDLIAVPCELTTGTKWNIFLPWVSRKKLSIKIVYLIKSLGLMFENLYCWFFFLSFLFFFFEALATEINSKIEEKMWVIQVTRAADRGNKLWGTAYSEHSLCSDFQMFWSVTLFCWCFYLIFPGSQFIHLSPRRVLIHTHTHTHTPSRCMHYIHKKLSDFLLFSL